MLKTWTKTIISSMVKIGAVRNVGIFWWTFISGNWKSCNNFVGIDIVDNLRPSNLIHRRDLVMDGEESNPEGEDVFSYGDMHKIVLQGIMSAGFLDARGNFFDFD